MKKLSIIVPMYKVEAYIEECLLSCVHQDLTEDEYEIIVVDDGSPDGSAGIVERLMPVYPQIRMIRQANQGLSMARNNGLDIAEGKYIWFVDSDDRIQENCLNELLTTLERSECRMMRIGARFDEDKSRGRVIDGIQRWDEILSDKQREVCVPFYIYERSLLSDNNLRFYPGIYHEDSEFTPRALYAAGRIAGYSQTLYYVRENSSSITHVANSKKSFDILTICRMTDEWSQTLGSDGQAAISLHIAMTLNSALRHIKKCDNTEQIKFYQEWKKNAHLIRHYLKSKRPKYIAEWGYLKLKSLW